MEIGVKIESFAHCYQNTQPMNDQINAFVMCWALHSENLVFFIYSL